MTGAFDMKLFIDPYEEAELAAQMIAVGDRHIDDGLIEAKKEKTLQELYTDPPRLRSDIYPFNFRCPFCPGRQTPTWTWTVLLDHASAYGKAGRHTYKVAGVHQALVDYMVLPNP
ncbi:unnamed protein product [Urochloa decumbens]|uniref:Zinc finger-XS domain-containing protein n=1 Tax=Urochloa decumbens TaxID=240449 RepID=A0ABC8VM30_9POAL